MHRSHIILLALCLLFCGRAGNAQTLQAPTVTVTGTAELKVAPDEALLFLEIEGQDKSYQKAKALNDAALQKLLTALKPLIPDQRQLQIGYVGFDLDPEVERINETAQVVSMFKLKREVLIELRDLSQFDAVLAEITKAGFTQRMIIEFRSSKLLEQRDKARLLALKMAQEKAAKLATEIGQSIGKAVSITELAENDFDQRLVRVGATTFSRKPGDASSLPQPGLLSVKASVSASFELK